MSKSERLKDGNGFNVFWVVGCEPESPLEALALEQVDPEDGEADTFVAEVEVVVALAEDDSELLPQTVVAGHVSTANELLFNGSSSDWLPKLNTDPQLMAPLEDPLPSSSEEDPLAERDVEDNVLEADEERLIDSVVGPFASISAKDPE